MSAYVCIVCPALGITVDLGRVRDSALNELLPPSALRGRSPALWDVFAATVGRRLSLVLLDEEDSGDLDGCEDVGTQGERGEQSRTHIPQGVDTSSELTLATAHLTCEQRRVRVAIGNALVRTDGGVAAIHVDSMDLTLMLHQTWRFLAITSGELLEVTLGAPEPLTWRTLELPAVSHYALVLDEDSSDRPIGVVRRRRVGGRAFDEVWTRRRAWEPTEYLRRYALGHNDIGHLPISEAEADDLTSSDRTQWSRSKWPRWLVLNQRDEN